MTKSEFIEQIDNLLEALTQADHNYRKNTGSQYTPPEIVACRKPLIMLRMIAEVGGYASCFEGEAVSDDFNFDLAELF